MNKERISCLCVVAFLLLSLLGTRLAGAREVQEGKAADGIGEEIAPDEALKVPITVVYSGYGFALEGDGEEFHLLRILILRVRSVEPPYIRGLMEENKSIEEIKGEIIEKGWASFYRGDMRFVEEHYRLVNISLTREGDNLSINADVMLPSQGSGPLQSEGVGSVGNISITVMGHEGVRIGKGKLAMYGEEYRVLLGLLPPLSGK